MTSSVYAGSRCFSCSDRQRDRQHNETPVAGVLRSNIEDPYLQLGDSEDESEADDMTFRDTDLIILAARNEDDVSHLEVRHTLYAQVMQRQDLRLRRLPHSLCSLAP